MRNCIISAIATTMCILLLGLGGTIGAQQHQQQQQQQHRHQAISPVAPGRFIDDAALHSAAGSEKGAFAAAKLRAKRRIQDVEKLMNEDEFMSYLICDMCLKNACGLKYCKFCLQCQNRNLNDMYVETAAADETIVKPQTAAEMAAYLNNCVDC